MSNNIVQFNEEIIKGQIKELVRGSVEEALIEMYLAECLCVEWKISRKPCGAAGCPPPPSAI